MLLNKLVLLKKAMRKTKCTYNILKWARLFTSKQEFSKFNSQEIISHEYKQGVHENDGIKIMQILLHIRIHNNALYRVVHCTCNTDCSRVGYYSTPADVH